MDTYANSYQAYGNIVGPPISRSGSAFGDTSYRSGNTRHGCGIITAHPPGIERTASVAGSMCDVGTELYSPSGMYDLPSPDLPPSWPAPPSYSASTAAHHTGDYPISVSLKPPADIIQASIIDFASGYPSTKEAYSFDDRIDPRLMAFHPGGSFILPEPPTSSTQVTRAPVSPGGGRRSIAGDPSCRQSRERASWEPMSYEEPGPDMDLVRPAPPNNSLSKGNRPSTAGRSSPCRPRERAPWEPKQYSDPDSFNLVHPAPSDSSRSASFSSYRPSHSNRIKKSQQNLTNFFERLQTTGRGLLSRFTGATASVSGTTHNNLYRRFVKW